MGTGISGLCMAWAHEICSGDNEERAIVVGTMNEAAYFFQAWLPLIFWQQVEAPKYHKGFVLSAFLEASMILLAVAVRYLWMWEQAGRLRKGAALAAA
jgi:ACS family pantothenate transporter-like MFS transporter